MTSWLVPPSKTHFTLFLYAIKSSRLFSAMHQIVVGISLRIEPQLFLVLVAN